MKEWKRRNQGNKTHPKAQNKDEKKKKEKDGVWRRQSGMRERE